MRSKFSVFLGSFRSTHPSTAWLCDGGENHIPAPQRQAKGLSWVSYLKKKEKKLKQNPKPNKPHPFFHVIILCHRHFVKPGKMPKKKNYLDSQGNTCAKMSNS